MHWRRKWQLTPVFLPGESQGREAWWAAVYGVAQSRTPLKQCSSSSSSRHTGAYIFLNLEISPDMCPGVGLLGHMVTLFLIFLRNFHNILRSGFTNLIPSNNVGEFPFLHTLSSICYL